MKKHTLNSIFNYKVLQLLHNSNYKPQLNKLPCTTYVLMCFLAFMILYGCSNENKENVAEKKQFIELAINSEYRIPLDDSTGFKASSIQFIEGLNGANNILILQYRDNNCINLYEYDEKKLVKKIIFEKEGPNGVGNSLNGAFWVSSTEIYLYSYWERRLYMVDENARVLKMLQLDKENVVYPVLEPGTNRPIIKLRDNNLLLAGYLFKTLPKEVIGKPFVKANIDDGTLSLVGTYPDKIFQGDWSMKAQTYYDYIPSSNKVVVSFAISDSVLVTDLNNENDWYLASSKLIQPIQPISEDYEFKVEDKSKGYAYDLSSEYFGVKYDKYRKLYYRFGIIGRTEKEFDSGTPPTFFAIILDEKFNKIGEHIFSKGEYPTMCFVAKDGLYIADKNKYTEDENHLYFNIYLPDAIK